MQEPQKPWAPFESTQKYTEEPLISIEMIPNDSVNLDEHLEEWKHRNAWKEGDFLPEVREMVYDNPICSVAELVSKIPVGVDPRDVHISIHRDRYLDCIEFLVNVRKPTNKTAMRAAFMAANQDYEKAMAQYQHDLAVYNEWFTAQEIARKKKEIEILEKRLPKET